MTSTSSSEWDWLLFCVCTLITYNAVFSVHSSCQRYTAVWYGNIAYVLSFFGFGVPYCQLQHPLRFLCSAFSVTHFAMQHTLIQLLLVPCRWNKKYLAPIPANSIPVVLEICLNSALFQNCDQVKGNYTLIRGAIDAYLKAIQAEYSDIFGYLALAPGDMAIKCSDVSGYQKSSTCCIAGLLLAACMDTLANLVRCVLQMLIMMVCTFMNAGAAGPKPSPTLLLNPFLLCLTAAFLCAVWRHLQRDPDRDHRGWCC